MEKEVVVQKLIDVMNEISRISDFRCVVKKTYSSLSRKLKLLMPMFEELKDSKEQIHGDSLMGLVALRGVLEEAKDLLTFGSCGSKIYLVLEREQIMHKFQEVTARLEQTLSGVSLEKLDISDEVKEQVELVTSQFRRAKGRVDAPDVELYEDLSSVYNKRSVADTDLSILRRLAEKLQLMDIIDLKDESVALHEMVVAKDGDPGGSIENISMLLKKFKDFVLTENPDISDTTNEMRPPIIDRQASMVPDDFRCPISLELMKDPVTISTGQTYDRVSIEKWLEAGHGTCPKTQEMLSNMTLTPNYVLRSLIAQWCEANGLEPPTRPETSQLNKTTSSCSPAERARVDILLRMLASDNIEDQRSAAGELRLLSKINKDNRICIAEAGAIPLLIRLLTTPDPRTQEHAVTALLNLSIYEDNKGSIISSQGALRGIVHVLKRGSMEARENAAATIFSLSVVDANKVTIGVSGAIRALVTLLGEGSQRGKKDAATALFNLCRYQGNKGKAVRAGVVPTLMRLVKEPEDSMVDESLTILSLLASHPDGNKAIGDADALPVLVEVIRSGSSRNKENATAILVHLCSVERHLIEAQELGVMGPLFDLVENGTDRAKRKAGQLLEYINTFIELRKLADAQANEQVQGETHHSPLPS